MTAHSSTSAPVRTLLMAPLPLLEASRTRLGADARFQIVAEASTQDALLAQLAQHPPELLLVDGTLLPEPETLRQIMTLHTGVTFVLLPSQQALAHASDIPGARFLVTESISFKEALEEMYHTVLRTRQQTLLARGGHPLYAHFASPFEQFLGLRRQAIAVWSPQGGTGKSTLALALALESASRQQPTLLVGLGAPDPLPLVSGLAGEPNLNTWVAQPTPEMLKSAIQKLETLDVLAGFPTLPSASLFARDAGSLQTLLDQAFGVGYTTVVLDVSHQPLAPVAIQAAQEVVLVTLPTLAGVLSAVEAVRVCERPMHLVVNRLRRESLAPEELFRMGRDTLAHFPPLVTVLVEDPAIGQAEQARQLPYQRSAALRQGMKCLGDQLFTGVPRPPDGVTSATPVLPPPRGRAFSLGPLKVRFT